MQDANLYALIMETDFHEEQICHQLVSSDSYQAHNDPKQFTWVYKLDTFSVQEGMAVKANAYKRGEISLDDIRVDLNRGEERWARHLKQDLEDEDVSINNDEQFDAFLRAFEMSDDWEHFENLRLEEFVEVLEPRMPPWASIEWSPVSMGSFAPILCLDAPHTISDFVRHLSATSV